MLRTSMSRFLLRIHRLETSVIRRLRGCCCCWCCKPFMKGPDDRREAGDQQDGRVVSREGTKRREEQWVEEGRKAGSCPRAQLLETGPFIP